MRKQSVDIKEQVRKLEKKVDLLSKKVEPVEDHGTILTSISDILERSGFTEDNTVNIPKVLSEIKAAMDKGSLPSTSGSVVLPSTPRTLGKAQGAPRAPWTPNLLTPPPTAKYGGPRVGLQAPRGGRGVARATSGGRGTSGPPSGRVLVRSLTDSQNLTPAAAAKKRIQESREGGSSTAKRRS